MLHIQHLLHVSYYTFNTYYTFHVTHSTRSARSILHIQHVLQGQFYAFPRYISIVLQIQHALNRSSSIINTFYKSRLTHLRCLTYLTIHATRSKSCMLHILFARKNVVLSMIQRYGFNPRSCQRVLILNKTSYLLCFS